MAAEVQLLLYLLSSILPYSFFLATLPTKRNLLTFFDIVFDFVKIKNYVKESQEVFEQYQRNAFS